MPAHSNMETITLHSLDEMQTFADGVRAGLRPEAKATVLALSGNLGAGKTTFVQCLARTLHIPERVTSPTFLVMRRYELSESDFKNFVHVDAYRIEHDDEVLVLGLPTLLDDPHTLIVIEWAERISSYIPDNAFRFTFTHGEGDTRIISFTTHGITS